MSVIDNIKSTKATRERRSISVPEWPDGDGKPSVIFTKPVTSVDYVAINRVHKNFTTENNIDGMVAMLIRKAEDVNGEKIFTAEDTMTLRTEPVTLMALITRKLFEDDLMPDADELGNA